MTVTSTAMKTIALGNGVATSFAFAFNIPASGDEQIIYTDASGTSTVLTAGTGASNYTVSAFNNPLGGTVTYPNSGTPIASGTQLTIARIMPLTQGTSFASQGANYPAAFEQIADYLTFMVQQLSEQQDRLVQAPITDPTTTLYLPSAAARASKVMAFDAAGNITATVSMPEGSLSAAMTPVVGAATLALARSYLGLGTAAVEGIGRGLEDDGAASLRVKFPLTVTAANVAPTVANHLAQYAATAALTVTLPQSSTCFAGYALWIYAPAVTGSVTVTPYVSDAIYGNASSVSITLAAGTGAFLTTDAAGNWYVIATSNGSGGSSGAPVIPGGYLTLVSGQTVPLNDVASAATLYYTPDAHGYVPVYSGTAWTNYAFAELSCAFYAAAQLASTIYDCFIITVAGAPTLVIGPAWRNSGKSAQMSAATNASPIVISAVSHGLSNGDVVTVSGVQGNIAANGQWTVSGVSANAFTLAGSTGNGTYTAGTGQFAARGVGAGTTQLVRQNGFWTNAVSMTAYNGTGANTVAASQGTYVGSVLIDGTAGQVTCHRFYGQSRKWGLWNAYNRKPIILKAGDSTASWIYGTVTWRASNNAAANSLTLFAGLAEEDVALSCAFAGSGVASAAYPCVGVGYGSVTIPYGVPGRAGSTAAGTYACTSVYRSPPSLGALTVTALEEAGAAASTTFYGTESGSLLMAAYRG